MRKKLFEILLALCMVTNLAACGEQESASISLSESVTSFGGIPELAEGQAAQSVVPGTFSMPYGESYGWNPYSCVSMENQAVMSLIYQGLFTLTPDFEAEPVLAESYTVSEDGCTYTIKLQSARFSSGSSLKAEDVVYSMGQAAGSVLYQARFRDIIGYEYTAEDTVVIHLERANDRLPCLLNFPIIPNQSGTAEPVGTGPFVRNGTVLLKDQNWWQGADTIALERVELYASASAEDTRDHFEIDMVHFVYNAPTASTAAEFHCDYELWNSRNTVMQYIGFNIMEGVCQDSRIRKAIIRAIDRAEIAESVYHNFADPASLPVAPTSSIYDEELAGNYDYDAAEALSELLASGSFYLPEDDPVRTGEDAETAEPEEDEDENIEVSPKAEEETLPSPESETSAENGEEGDEEEELEFNNIVLLVLAGNTGRSNAAKMAADCLEDVGFTVEIKVLEQEEFVYTINTGEYDLYYADVNLTPDFDIRSLLLTGGVLNYSYISDATLEELFDSAMENSGNRYDLYQYVMEKAYLCPILFQNNAVFTTRGMFTGLNPALGNPFYQMENITINDNDS